MKKGIVIGAILIILIAVIVMVVIPKENKEEEIKTDIKQSLSAFSVKYEGVNVLPGEEFDKETITDEEPSVSEIQSCAFDGMDTVYTYQDIEFTVANIDGKSKIYSTYFRTEKPETGEGVKLFDSKDVMIEKYGNDYTEKVNQYVYTKENVELTFIVQDNVITSIEYTLIFKD